MPNKVLDRIEAATAKAVVKAYRRNGDLVSRTVRVDLEGLAQDSGLEEWEALLGLALLIAKGDVELVETEPDEKTVKAAARAAAELDLHHTVGDVDEETYGMLLEALSKVSGLALPRLNEVGQLDKHSVKRVEAFLHALRDWLCKRLTALAETLKSVEPGSVLAKALAIEATVAAEKALSGVSARLVDAVARTETSIKNLVNVLRESIIGLVEAPKRDVSEVAKIVDEAAERLCSKVVG